MITFTAQQLMQIGQLRPLTDSSFIYNADKWRNLNRDYIELISVFAGKAISRNDVLSAFKNYYEDKTNDNYMKAFLLCMIWGFGNTGYGTYRTNNYILTEENRIIIKAALDYIEENNSDSLKKAFEKLKKIKGLSISYITKILYFATKANETDRYALIFDIRVATSLVRLTTPKEIFDIISIGPSSKFEDYERFNTLIYNISKKNGIEADQLEMYLFNQVF